MKKYKRQTKHSPLYLRFFSLYLIFILLTLFGLMLPFYFTCASILQKNIINANYSLCTIYSNQIDNILKEIDNNLTSLTTNQNIYDFCSNSVPAGLLNEQTLDHFYAARTAINRYSNLNSDIDTLYLYSLQSNYIISSNGNIQILNDFLHSNNPLPLETISQNTWTYMPSQHAGYGKLFLIKNATPLSLRNYGYLIVSLSVDNLFSALSQAQNYIVRISDADGHIIVQFSNSDVPDILSASSYLASDYTSAYSGLQYTILTPKNILMQPIYQFGYFATILCIGIFLLSLLLAFHFSKRNYNPIRNTTNFVMQLAEISPQKNELDSIVSATNKLKLDINCYQNVFGNKNSMNSVFIRNLIQGVEYSSSQLSTLGPFLGINFSKEFSVIVVLTAETYLTDQSFGADQDTTQFAITNILNEMLSDEELDYLIGEYNDEIILLLNLDENALSTLSQIMHKVHCTINHYLKIFLSISIGQPVNCLNNIKQSYLQACKALNNRYLDGKNRVIDSRNTAASTLQKYILQLKPYETKLTNFAKVTDFNSCKLILEELKAELKQNSAINPETIQYDLFTMSIRVLFQIEQDHATSFVYQSIYREYFYIKSIDDYCEWFLNMLMNVSTSPNQTNSSKNIVQDIIQYINCHYTDELSLNFLADLFGLSSSYLSTLLNRELHTSLTTYINHLRIDTAKKMLRTNQYLQIQDIAKKVGYNNIHTFLRAFKKEEGVTPNIYRDLYSN